MNSSHKYPNKAKSEYEQSLWVHVSNIFDDAK